MERSNDISNVNGIGPKTKELLNELGVYTTRDILLRFPRNYYQYPKMILPEELNEDTFVDGMKYGLNLKITKIPLERRSSSKSFTTVYEKGIELIWFHSPHIKKLLVPGKHYVFYGILRKNGARLVMAQPEVFEVEDYVSKLDVIFPVYSLPSKLGAKVYRKIIGNVLLDLDLYQDYLPDEVRKRYDLSERNYAIKQIHFPDDFDSLSEARNRLVFDEFFHFIMLLRFQKDKKIKESNQFQFIDKSYINSIIDKLPYRLTDGQTKSVTEIMDDMTSPYQMQRLLQGDVGSGKTILALLIMLWCSKSGYQSAIMAPTEVLATQHYETFLDCLKRFEIDVPVILLTGQMKAKEKREARARIADTPNAIIVGTHALIQEMTDFMNLAFIVTDEQHRFGVKQREVFSKKGMLPHILVMSATPIPRTLAIIIYGDMDISTIDHVPSERLPIKNCVVGTKFRPKAYEWIVNEVNSGHQAYVICPLVEESENMDGENVIDYTKRLRAQLPEHIRVEYLHGKMKGPEKIRIMEAFLNNEIQILVSTTVVEVGVNVPNATVMMIENADRFGLAQLHQLRGRVGRGDAQSYCIFVNTSASKNSKKRLEILNSSNDGFQIANADLKLRGPGDFFGIRQSGELAFDLADIYQDSELLLKAQEAVTNILAEDEQLILDKNKKLRHEMDYYASQQLANMNL